MRQDCIDTFETKTAPLPSWGQWAEAGVRMVKADIVQLVSIVWQWNTRWRHRQHLRTLSDHALRDVGLSRSDIESQANKPFWES